MESGVHKVYRLDNQPFAQIPRQAIRDNRIDDQQAGRLLRFYEAGLQGYTYLEDAHDS